MYSEPVPMDRYLLKVPGCSRSVAPILFPHDGHSNTLWVDSPSNAAPQNGQGMLTVVARSNSPAVAGSSFTIRSARDMLRQ